MKKETAQMSGCLNCRPVEKSGRAIQGSGVSGQLGHAHPLEYRTDEAAQPAKDPCDSSQVSARDATEGHFVDSNERSEQRRAITSPMMPPPAVKPVCSCDQEGDIWALPREGEQGDAMSLTRSRPGPSLALGQADALLIVIGLAGGDREDEQVVQRSLLESAACYSRYIGQEILQPFDTPMWRQTLCEALANLEQAGRINCRTEGYAMTEYGWNEFANVTNGIDGWQDIESSFRATIGELRYTIG